MRINFDKCKCIHFSIQCFLKFYLMFDFVSLFNFHCQENGFSLCKKMIFTVQKKTSKQDNFIQINFVKTRYLVQYARNGIPVSLARTNTVSFVVMRGGCAPTGNQLSPLLLKHFLPYYSAI